MTARTDKLAACHSSARTGEGRDDWCTPEELVQLIEQRHDVRLVLDTACESHNAICRPPWGHAYHHDRGVDGLTREWHYDVNDGCVAAAAAWCNPPYSDASAWMAKARAEGQRCTVVCLVPARTDVQWWAQHVHRPDGRTAAARIDFLVGRVSFVGGGPAPFPSAVIVYQPGHEGPPVVATWDWKREGQGVLELAAA